MQTSDLQFNIIYTPGTVRYLTPFALTLLRWSDCQYRLVANGCAASEVELLQAVCDLDDRLSLLTMPQEGMLPHGETLDFLHERTSGDYFCFMDSDILAVGPFLDEFTATIANSEVFSSGLPLWHNDYDTVIPDDFKHMHGIHAYTADRRTIACDYFVIYDNASFSAVRNKIASGLKVVGWQDIAPENQAVLRRLGQERQDYDSGKVLTLLMIADGARVNYMASDNLKHIGGFTEVGTGQGRVLYSRGKLDRYAYLLPGWLGTAAIKVADRWYAARLAPQQNSRAENISIASKIRRRTITARYFYKLIVGLMDDQPVPPVPKLGDTIAEDRLHMVTDDIRALVKEVRENPGPWQDAA